MISFSFAVTNCNEIRTLTHTNNKFHIHVYRSLFFTTPVLGNQIFLSLRKKRHIWVISGQNFSTFPKICYAFFHPSHVDWCLVQYRDEHEILTLHDDDDWLIKKANSIDARYFEHVTIFHIWILMFRTSIVNVFD